MKWFLGSLFLVVLIGAALVGCAGNNSQSVPLSPYGACAPGQPCALGIAPNCAPGTAGCVLAQGAYIHFTGELSGVSSGVARSIISQAYDITSFCWPNCYTQSTVDVIIVPGSVGQGTLNIGGYPIGGQAYTIPTGTNGTDVQISGFAGRIDVVTTNFPLDGSVSAIPNVEVRYNGQHLATTSLLRAAF